MRHSTPFLALVGLACVLAMGSPSGARPRVAPSPSPSPTPSPTRTAAPTDTPTAAPSDTSSPSAEPSPTPSPSPSPSASPSPSVTPYVRRYFNGRPIDTPPPTPTGSLTPTPIPTTTPYVRRYFQGRLIDTPPPTLTPPGVTSPSPSPSPLTTATAIPHRVQPTPLVGSDALLGDWDCTTFGGTHLTHEFSRADDAVSLDVTTTILLPNGKTAMLHESYKHNPNTHVWTAVLAGGLIFAKGSDWTGDTWTLVGQTRESGAPTRFRMIFTALGTDAYRRDFQRPDGISWATYAGETCRRTQL